MDYDAIAAAGGFGKGPTRKRLKGRKKRAEGKLVQEVRPQCVERDGYCRIVRDESTNEERFGACEGLSEWSHYNETHRRSKTRGMAPERRHDRKHSMMLCSKHSHDYDQHRLDIVEVCPALGCDGRLKIWNDRHTYVEGER